MLMIVPVSRLKYFLKRRSGFLDLRFWRAGLVGTLCKLCGVGVGGDDGAEATVGAESEVVIGGVDEGRRAKGEEGGKEGREDDSVVVGRELVASSRSLAVLLSTFVPAGREVVAFLLALSCRRPRRSLNSASERPSKLVVAVWGASSWRGL